jgi:hypothetical protein
MADDLYDFVNVDKVTDRNTYPEAQPEEKQRPSNPEGHVNPETVDHFQEHPFESQFNDATGLLSIYDPTNPDRQLFDIIETEVIQLTAPPIKYYKLIHQAANIDPLYGESRRRDAYEMPVTIYGHYDDPSPSQELQQWGLQQTEEIELWFNYNNMVRTIGDRLQIGDVLQTYDAKLWEVMTSIVQDENLWRAQHNMVRAKKLQTEGFFLPHKIQRITTTPNVPKVGTGPIIPSRKS